MSRRYYPLQFRLHETDRFLLWYTNDVDGVITTQNYLLWFDSLAALNDYAQQHQLVVESETPPFYNFDTLQGWLSSRYHRGFRVDCDDLLNAWNLFTDCAVSVQQMFEPAWAAPLYTKLFWGTNPPSLTPPNVAYHPRWKSREVVRLQAVLSLGLALFQRMLAPNP